MEDKRLISEERGRKVAEENGIKFFETSAKENINIEIAFNSLAEDILNKQRPVEDNERKGGVVPGLGDGQAGSGGPGSCCKM